MKIYSQHDLDDFDRITRMESSRYQMDRIRARLEWNEWKNKNGWDTETLDAMKQELIDQGRW